MTERLGHEVVLDVSSNEQLVDASRNLDVELVISSMRLEDGDAIEALVRVCEEHPVPTIIVTPRSDLASVEHAMEDHVMAYLVEPIADDDLRPTITLVLARFDEFRSLQQEIQDLKSALSARKVVERAKGQLMKERDLSETDAFRSMQKAASRRRQKLVRIAEAILEGQDLDDDLKVTD